MRCKILDEGRSHRRWEYILEFDKPFDTKSFVSSFNDAILTTGEYKHLLLDSQNSFYYLVNDSEGSEKRYAEFTFKERSSPREAILCVKRIEMARQDLHNFLETILGLEFNQRPNQLQQESQHDCHGQASLFQPEQ